MEMLQEFPQVLGIPEGHILDPAWKKINTDMQQFFHMLRNSKSYEFLSSSPAAPNASWFTLLGSSHFLQSAARISALKPPDEDPTRLRSDRAELLAQK